MKKNITRILKELIIIMGIFSFLTGCNSDREVEGGSTTYVDKDAPKEIKSKDLCSMDCKVSTATVSELEEGLVYGWYYFSVKKDSETGEITGSYKISEQYNDFVVPEFTFKTDKAFLEKVQAIIEESKIVTSNGIHHETKGIPDDFGYDFSAVYASGESISCSDNQSSDIGQKTVKELYELFYKESGAESYYDTDELLSVYYYVYEKDKYTLWVYAYKNLDGTYACKVTESIEKKQTPYGEKAADKEFMDGIARVFTDNDMAGINEYPRRESTRSYTLKVKFGTEEYEVKSNTAINDTQFAALEGLQDYFLDFVKK